MNLNFIYAVVIALSIFITSCASEEEEYVQIIPEDLPTYKINPTRTSTLDLEDILTEVEFTPLNLPHPLSLTTIRKAVIDDGSIYLLDGASAGRIFKFDQNGAFVFVLDRPGRGPGEYEFIYDFTIINNKLVLSTTATILFFDKSDGSYLKTYSNNFDKNWVQWIHLFDEKTGVAASARGRANRTMNQLKFFDFETKSFIYEAIPFPSHAMMMSVFDRGRHLYTTPDGLFTRPVNSNIVYKIEFNSKEDISVEPHYHLDFGDHWVPESFLKTSFKKMDAIWSKGLNHKYVHTFEVYETANTLYIAYEFKAKQWVYLRDKATGKFLEISEFTQNNLGWSMNPLTTHNNTFVALTYPAEILEKGAKLHPKLEKIISADYDEMTPIMVFATFSIK